MLFLDFKQAFESVDRGTSCKVLHREKIGHGFGIESGVKQGSILFPLLLILVLDWVLTKANTEQHRIQWSLTQQLEDLDFADDITVCLLTLEQIWKLNNVDLKNMPAKLD